jgi:Ca2+/Na+ antiporter
VGLGQGAVGSVLAAVATALPESLIPVVAIIGGEAGSKDVATGAILGAPLLLATVAMVLVGVSALIYRERRPQGLALNVHFPTLERDLQSTLPVSIGLGFTAWELDTYAVLAGCLALAGGLVAIITLQIRRRFSARAIVLWATLYVIFVAYVVATT